MTVEADHHVTTVEQLRTLYREPSTPVQQKEVDIIDEGGARLIAASPFVVVATTGPNGLDCSPKGGPPGFVKVLDERTLLLPDWSGNNRLDGLQNILADPRVGLVFIYPGHDEVFRVSGTAILSTDPRYTQLFEHEGRAPRVVIAITVTRAFIHCGRAIQFGRLWDGDGRVPAGAMPDIGEVIRAHIARTRELSAAQG